MIHTLTSVNQILVCSCCKEHTNKTSSPEIVKVKISNYRNINTRIKHTHINTRIFLIAYHKTRCILKMWTASQSQVIHIETWNLYKIVSRLVSSTMWCHTVQQTCTDMYRHAAKTCWSIFKSEEACHIYTTTHT